MKSRNEQLNSPGEYGLPHKPEGWVCITLPELNHQQIYLASESFATALAHKHGIAKSAIVTLNHDTVDGKHIPEEFLDGQKGLALIRKKLSKLSSSQQKIIIHCKQGLNRTPVAATTYLISQGIKPDIAKHVIETAYQKQRKDNFVINPYGHFTLVLEELGIERTRRQRRRLINPLDG